MCLNVPTIHLSLQVIFIILLTKLPKTEDLKKLMLNEKELTLCHKLWFSNPNIFGTQCRKPLIFQTYIFWSNKSQSLKFQRFTTLESKDIRIRKSEFVAKSQFLYKDFINVSNYLCFLSYNTIFLKELSPGHKLKVYLCNLIT